MSTTENDFQKVCETLVKYRRLLIALVSKSGGQVDIDRESIDQSMGMPLYLLEGADFTQLTVVTPQSGPFPDPPERRLISLPQ